MASIEKRGEKFQVRWWTLSGVQKKRICSTRESARELAREIEHCIDTGTDWAPKPAVVSTEPDIEEVTKAFIEHRALRLRASTLRRYGEGLDIFERFLRTRVPRGKLLVSLLTRPLLEDYYSWLCRPENGLHKRARMPDTSRKILEIAQLMWQWADASDRWLNQIPRPKQIEMVRNAVTPVVAPTWVEMDACVAACRGWHKQLATVLRYTGLRVGETMLLEWRDVNMDKGTLIIRPETSKTGAGRMIPLSSHLLEEIATWGKREGYLVPNGRRKGDRYRQAQQSYVARAWVRAGVRPEACEQPNHAFRRGWKSGMLSINAHPDAVDYLQGHSLGRGGARSRYIDPWQALPLVEVAGQVPKIGVAASAASNVVPIGALAAAVGARRPEHRERTALGVAEAAPSSA